MCIAGVLVQIIGEMITAVVLFDWNMLSFIAVIPLLVFRITFFDFLFGLDGQRTNGMEDKLNWVASILFSLAIKLYDSQLNFKVCVAELNLSLKR